jgi:lipoprotein-anchoring transpeptidase ErfK/SrfK
LSKRRQPARHRSPQKGRRFGLILRWTVVLALLAAAAVGVWELRRPNPFQRIPALQRPALQLKQAWRERVASHTGSTPVPAPTLEPSLKPPSASPPQPPEPEPARIPAPQPIPAPEPPRTDGQAATNTLAAQIILMRQALSPGVIDGVMGSQTRVAVLAYQQREGIPVTGVLDATTRARLRTEEPLFVDYFVTPEDLARLEPLSPTWLGKSQQRALEFETVLELVAEQSKCRPSLVRSLNPTVDWTRIGAGTRLRLPNTTRQEPDRPAAFVLINLSERTLRAYDTNTNLLALFPCSIGRVASKRPTGELHVEVRIPNPNYTFNPAIFPESSEGRELGRKLVVAPGPNNPVGTAWIGLDKPGYGIHGTPIPEKVGRTESHGCFRLANWDAEYLLQLVWNSMPVRVEE